MGRCVGSSHREGGSGGDGNRKLDEVGVTPATRLGQEDAGKEG
jgi:hypothetical protein